jgi:hypothetical protein
MQDLNFVVEVNDGDAVGGGVGSGGGAGGRVAVAAAVAAATVAAAAAADDDDEDAAVVVGGGDDDIISLYILMGGEGRGRGQKMPLTSQTDIKLNTSCIRLLYRRNKLGPPLT